MRGGVRNDAACRYADQPARPARLGRRHAQGLALALSLIVAVCAEVDGLLIVAGAFGLGQVLGAVGGGMDALTLGGINVPEWQREQPPGPGAAPPMPDHPAAA